MARAFSAASGRGADAASVSRRSVSWASSSAAWSCGALPGHQITTGESGSSSGRTTEAGWSATAPRIRITTTSPGVPSPMCTSASRPACRPPLVTTSRIRDGCSRPAAMLASSASANSDSSQTTIRVSTMPWAGLPAVRRARSSSAEILAELVSSSVMITVLAARAGARFAHADRSWPPPGEAVAGQHRVGAGRAPDPGSYRSGCSDSPAQ